MPDVSPDTGALRRCRCTHIGNYMVTDLPVEAERDFDARLDALFGALAHGTRRAILSRLTEGEATVGELAEPFDMSRPAVSKHLNVLEDAGLVRRIPDGRINRCRFDPEALGAAAAWVDRYRRHWEGRLEALADYLEREEER